MKLGLTKSRMNAATIGLAGLIALQAAVPASLIAQNTAAPGGAAGITAGNAANASGFLSSATGVVFVRRGRGPEVPAKVGDLFGPGTQFRTGGESNAVLVFADGQNVTLSSNSELRVDDFKFDARDLKSSKSAIGLVSGVMRLVTGAIHTGNFDGLRVSAGDAKIDILSKDTTAFVVEIDPKSVGIGAAAVILGEISVKTPMGKPETLVSDQFTRWQSNLPPTPGVPVSAAPAIFQALVAALRATVIPSNSPIDVRSASVQAALTGLPAPGAGSSAPIVQAQAPESGVTISPAATTSGGGRGCVGSPC